MGDAARAKKPQQEPAPEPARPKPPLGMSADDRSLLDDLLFQQAAQTTFAALLNTDPRKRLELAARAVTQARAALDNLPRPANGTLPRSMFASIDGAFMALIDLHLALRAPEDPASATQATAVEALILAMRDRLGPAGWKDPSSVGEGRARAIEAGTVGATHLDVEERGRLGRLHLRAARQQLLDGWEGIAAGKLAAVPRATDSLSSAATLLVDPRLAETLADTADELTQTEVVFERVVTALRETAPTRIAELRELASALDALLRIAKRKPQWVDAISGGAGTTTAPTSGATRSQENGSTAAGGAKGEPSEQRDPRAAPAVHKIDQIQHFVRKVHIMDTNYFDEYVGFVELFFEAYKTPSGQVYVQKAEAKKHFNEDGTQYLSLGANIMASSIEMGGKQFCDVYFDIEIGGPNRTETESVGLGFKASGSSTAQGETAGGEVSATVTFSKATTSRGSKNFRRVYRISSLAAPVKIPQFDSTDANRPKMTSVSMRVDERTDLHQDFDGFRLDDDDVGDTVLDPTNADWILHSYSED